MPTGNVWSNDWLWANSQRKYPLFDTVTCQDTLGQFTLPSTFLLDISIAVSADTLGTSLDVSKFRLSSVGSYSNGYVLKFSYDSALLGTATIPRSSHSWGLSYPVVNSTATIGFVVVGDLADIDSQPAGNWQFDASGGQLQPRCATITPAQLSGIQIVNNGVVSKPLTGTVLLEAGTNVEFDVSTVDETSSVYNVAISAVGNANYTTNCTAATATPIRTINSQTGDANGNFTITGLDCLTVSGTTNGILLKDTCATPCCGSSELSTVQTTLQALSTQYAALKDIYTAVYKQSASVSANVAAAMAKFPDSPNDAATRYPA